MDVRPSGTVTFLFTDIHGSTRLWDEHPDAMQIALARHDEIVRKAIDTFHGYLFSTGGDGVAAAFGRAADAVASAVDAQRALQIEQWPEPVVLQVRMGVHTGEVQERDGDYFGQPVNRAARLMAAAHGGQILVSEVTASVMDRPVAEALVNLGSHRLRGWPDPIRVFGVRAEGLSWVDQPLLTAAVGNLPSSVT